MSVQLPKSALPCLRATCHLVMAAPPLPPAVQDRARPPSLAVWLRPVGANGTRLAGATAVEASEAAPVPVAFLARTLNW